MQSLAKVAVKRAEFETAQQQRKAELDAREEALAKRAVAASRREGYPAPAYPAAPSARADSQG